jgi:hypothetical protein
MRTEAPRRRFAGALSWAALALGVAWAGSAGSNVAHAFSEPRSYFDSADNGGGGGRWFTGSPAEGYDCSVCHEGQPPQPLYVSGLPDKGYVAGASYDVRLAWPEFAQLAHGLRQMPGVEPSMGVVAEFVAENGKASGTVEIATDTALPTEQCELPPGAQAAHLYSVKPAKDAEEATRCSSEALGQRCLITVLGCGAAELHVRWTPPREWQGPIWFTAGFVATNQISGSPQGDAVSEFTRVMMPATSGSARYVSRLDGQCSVSGGTPALGGGAWIGAGRAAALPALVTASCAVALLARARRRRAARAT